MLSKVFGISETNAQENLKQKRSPSEYPELMMQQKPELKPAQCLIAMNTCQW